MNLVDRAGVAVLEAVVEEYPPAPVMEDVDPLSHGLLVDHGGGLLDEDPDDLLNRKPWLGVAASFIHSGRFSFWRDRLTLSSASDGVLSTTALRRSFSGTCDAKVTT